VPRQAEKANAILCDATEAGFAAVREGATCADIFHAMQHVLEKDFPGGSGVGRMGHGLGMQLTEWPSITSTDETVLRPGMVLTLEPSVEIEGGGMMVHEENLVLTPDGPVLLTRPAPKTLPVIAV
jgi:Xaa-Pro aminopeptidase